jgi:dUTP pyrophosphatase
MFDYLIRIIIDYFYNFINKSVQFKVKLLGYDSVTPIKADPGCAGYDVFSSQDVLITKGKRELVPLGIAVQVPEYYYLRVAPRSGLSVKGIDIGAGVIDSSYRGEVKVLVINNTDDDFIVLEGDKIAQLIMERCANAEIDICYDSDSDDDLDKTSRGDKGFGSTGN